MQDFIKFISGTNGETVDRTGLWTCFLTIVTAILCYIGWKQLNDLKKISKADFIKKFSSEFFNLETRALMLLIDYNALEFKVKEISYGKDVPSQKFPYFYVNQEILKQITAINSDYKFKNSYTGFDIDDCLLGYLEDIGCFEKQNLIGIQGVYDYFHWYIQKVWNCSELINYINYLRANEENGDTIYENFEYIFRKSSSFEKFRKGNGWFWLWKLKFKMAN